MCYKLNFFSAGAYYTIVTFLWRLYKYNFYNWFFDVVIFMIFSVVLISLKKTDNLYAN